MQDVERGDGARVGRVRRTAGDEIAGGDLAAVVVPERFVVVVDADVAVEVWEGVGGAWTCRVKKPNVFWSDSMRWR